MAARALKTTSPYKGSLRTPAPARQITCALGFKTWSAFALWTIIGGYFAGFNVWNMRKLDFEGSFQVNALPGEYSWMKKISGYKVLFTAHLACVLPCSVIALVQFIPQLRKRYMWVHQRLGNIFFALMSFGAPSGIAVAVHAFGAAESPSIRLSIVLTGVITLCFLAVSFFSISTLACVARLRLRLYGVSSTSQLDARMLRKLRAIDIQRHRNFILRTLATMSTGSFASVYLIVPELLGWQLGYVPFRCGTLTEDLGVALASSRMRTTYPACLTENGGLASTVVAVKADLGGSIEEITSWGRSGIGMAFWAGLVVHLILAEVYIQFSYGEEEN